MPAYWRLMAWERHQSTDELRRRARNDVTYNELWQRPDKWRGKLVEIRVHLRQAIRVDDLPDNPLSLKTIYEVCGWNSDSQPYWYWMITPRLPPGMPLGKDLYEEATFVGYFLKLQPYEDREGRSRAMPLLIGRLIWHPLAARPPAGGQWDWTWYLVVALAVLFVARWAMRLFSRGQAAGRGLNASTRHDAHQVDAWLEDAEKSASESSVRNSQHDEAEPRPPAESTGPLAGDRG
jgi:hypothetical protein